MDRNFFASPYRLDQLGEREAKSQKELTWQPEYDKWRYTYNIANEAAVDFYKMHGLEDIQPAFELGANKLKDESLIMPVPPLHPLFLRILREAWWKETYMERTAFAGIRRWQKIPSGVCLQGMSDECLC